MAEGDSNFTSKYAGFWTPYVEAMSTPNPRCTTPKYSPVIYDIKNFKPGQRSNPKPTRPPNQWTARVEMLAKPRRRRPKYFIWRKKIPFKVSNVRPAALKYVINERLLNLSKPRELKVTASEPILPVVTSSKKPAPKKTRSEVMEARKKWLMMRSKAKASHKPPPLPPRKRKPLKQLKARAEKLSKPLPRKCYTPEIPPPLVKRSALSYTLSARTKTLSVPRNIKNPKDRSFRVARGALTYEITPYTEELAKPRQRATATDSDLKENPYGVNPLALKARCSERTAELAKPKGVKK